MTMLMKGGSNGKIQMRRLSDAQAGRGETEGAVEPPLAVAYGLVSRLEGLSA
jgi:hypothetical protein